MQNLLAVAGGLACWNRAARA